MLPCWGPPCCQQRPPPRTSRLHFVPFLVRPPHGDGGSGGFGAASGFAGTFDTSRCGGEAVEYAGGPIGPKNLPAANAAAAAAVSTSAATSPGRGLAIDRQPRHRGPPVHGRFRSVSDSPQSQQKRARLGK